jgi:hypothetical protein
MEPPRLDQVLSSNKTLPYTRSERYIRLLALSRKQLDPASESLTGQTVDIDPAILLVVLCRAGLLMMIASLNIASLLLVRSEGRRRRWLYGEHWALRRGG